MTFLHRRMIYSAVLVLLFCDFSQQSSVVSTNQPCVVKGQFTTHLQWYGYLLQKTLHKEAKIEYQITYPERECCVNMMIYYDDQIKELKETMNCQQRNAILPVKNNQVISLSTQNQTKGCERYRPSASAEPLIVCTGERTLRSSGPRTWYIAISRCNSDSSKPLDMSFYFNVSNYFGVCEVDPLSNTFIPVRVESGTDVNVIVALGVICGISTIVAIVFGVLFFFGRRKRKGKKKAGSVTSSQATMTQDIFYVNPSLSERDQSDSQYSHSQSSGSENYYEVIPDRRSYESINTQLALHGQSLRGIHLSHGRDNRPNIPPYILEDYPPPPYQPQPLQNGVHHRQSSAGAVLQPGQNPANAAAGSTPLLNGHMIANGRPVHMSPGLHYNSSNVVGHNRSEQTLHKQVPIGNQSLRLYSQQRVEQNQGQIRPQSSQGNQTLPAGNVNQNVRAQHQMSDNSQQTNPSFSQANGSASNPNFVRQQIPNGGPKISNGVPNGQNIQLQTYGQNQNQQTQSIPTSNGRQNIPNGNVAKLLHDAYRIQQFETTA